MRLWLRVLSFSEFNPRDQSKPDWLAIALRFCLMAGFVVLPALFVLAREVFYEVPALKYLALVVVSLYVPALFMMRKPSVKVTPDFRIVLRNPKTVNSAILRKAAGSAISYFIIVSLVVLTTGGSGTLQFYPDQVAPVLREVFTIESPLDLVGIGFFLLICYVVIGGTISMLYYQVKYLAHATLSRSAPALSDLHPYTRSLIAGTAPELISMRATVDRRARIRLLDSIRKRLHCDQGVVGRALAAAFTQELKRVHKLVAIAKRPTRTPKSAHTSSGRSYVLENVEGHA